MNLGYKCRKVAPVWIWGNVGLLTLVFKGLKAGSKWSQNGRFLNDPWVMGMFSIQLLYCG